MAHSLNFFSGIIGFKRKYIRTYKCLCFIQKRFRNRFVCLAAKVEILTNYWDKLIWKIGFMAKFLKDSQTEEILHRIIVVPKQIQQAALKQFTKQSVELHAISFMQWRYMQTKRKTYDGPELERLIEEKISMMKDEEKS